MRGFLYPGAEGLEGRQKRLRNGDCMSESWKGSKGAEELKMMNFSSRHIIPAARHKNRFATEFIPLVSVNS